MQLKVALPEIDEQIKLLEQQLESMNQQEISGELIQNDIFKPSTDIGASILKFECKQLAIQDTMMGLKSADDIADLRQFLNNVRKLSEKQFKNVYKKNKLLAHQNKVNPIANRAYQL